MDGATATLQLNDPEHFNTFSMELGEDMRRVAAHTCCLPHVACVVLQGAGPHFSAGGNPYAAQRRVMSHAEQVFSLREIYDGFLQLRTLPHPVSCAVHGTVIGGGVAGCLHADHIGADRATVLEHGNLVRGLCVLGMLS